MTRSLGVFEKQEIVKNLCAARLDVTGNFY